MNKYAIVIIICLSFLAGCANFEKTIEKIATSPHSSESNQPRDKDQIKKSVVKITSQGRQGTGFIVGLVSNTTYILTISHVVGSNREPNVEFFGQTREFKARVLEIEGQQENGFALLAVTGSIPSEAIPLYVNDQFGFKSGELVFTFGFPLTGGDWAYGDLLYSSARGSEILFSGGNIKVGNSGCPLVKGDEVVGIVTSVDDFAHARSSRSAREFLRGAKGGNIVLEHMEKWQRVNWREAYEAHLKEIVAIKPVSPAKSDEQLPRGTIIAFAAEPGGIAMDGMSEDRNAVYTKYLLQEMQKPQDIENLLKRVAKLVRDTTKNVQRPWYNSAMEGGFCFGGCSKISLNNTTRQFALIIGNNNYSNVGKLEKSINDAQSMAEVLAKKGFEVTLRTDIDSTNMKQAIQQFAKRLSVIKGIGLFYFSGHGIQIDGRNYLVPIDHKQNEFYGNYGDVNLIPVGNRKSLEKIRIEATNDKENLVSVDNVVEQMQAAHSELSIIILDSCRSDLIPSGLK